MPTPGGSSSRGRYTPRELAVLNEARKRRENASAHGRLQGVQAQLARNPWAGRAYAGLKGVQHALTLGYDDHMIAGIEALRDLATRGQARYGEAYAAQKALANGVAARHPLSSSVGETSGLALALTVGGPGMALSRAPNAASGVASRAASRTVKGPRLQTKPREYATVAVAGGGVNAGMQVLTDSVTGRPVSAKNAAGAAVGGSVGTLATIAAGPRIGGALEGAVTPTVQALLTGRLPSADEVRSGMLLGEKFAGLAAMRGAEIANSLTPRQKGDLGELMSSAKTFARLDVPVRHNKPLDLARGGRTIIDHAGLFGDIIEAKFGEFARLTGRQRQAQSEYGDRYRVDRWRADDVGKAAGFGGGTLASHAGAREGDQR